MSEPHHTSTSFARRLRPSAERFAAAAAWQDPYPLLALGGARRPAQRPAHPPSPPSGGVRRRLRGAPASLAHALRRRSGAALLLVAVVAPALACSNSPYPARTHAAALIAAAVLLAPALSAAALVRLRRRAGAAPARSVRRPPLPSRCPA